MLPVMVTGCEQVTAEAVRSHSRRFRDFRYIYPVVSRRSGGLSIGINLNPDKRCNFDCTYCQVERGGVLPARADVDLQVLESELGALVKEINEEGGRGDGTGAGAGGRGAWLADLKDIAFSGDGEPTAFGRFGECVERVAKVRDRLCPAGVAIVLITNASGLHRRQVMAALSRIDAVWAKLDAGTEAFYRLICRPSVPYRRILENIRATARIKPVVIQSMFVRWQGEAPSRREVAAYAERLVELRKRGGNIDRVQIYTTARPPADPRVSALSEAELEEIAGLVRRRCGEKVETFGSWAAAAGGSQRSS